MIKTLMIFMFFVIFYETLANESENISHDGYSDYNANIYKKYVQIDKIVKGFAQQSVKRLLPFLLEARENVNISASCSRNVFELINGFRKLTNWSLNFLDATGKMQSGLLVGNVHMYGDYEECIDTTVTKKGKVDFQGKYCLLFIKPFLPKGLKIPNFYGKLKGFEEVERNSSDLLKELGRILHFFYVFSIRFGLCVPSGCSKQDISEMVKYTAGDYINATVSRCFKEGDIFFWTTRRINTVSIFVLFGLIVIICTWLDNTSEKGKNNNLSVKSRILRTFSLTRNFQKLMNTDVPENSITCLTGIRVLTLCWVMLGHEFFVYMFTLDINHSYLIYKKLYSSFITQIVVNGYISVDVFFFLSGFLNCYTRMLIKQSGKPQPGILKVLLHRLWRIYPAYIVSFLLMYLLNKPQPYTHYMQEEMTKNCDLYWWRNFLFINNFFDPLNLCMQHTWFLSSDMQLFVLTLFTIPVLLKKPKRGIFLHICIILIVNICSMPYWFLDDVPAPTMDGSRVDKRTIQKGYHMYILPAVHVGSYVIGILMGYAIATKKQIKISKVTQLLGWLIGSFLFLSMLFITVRWNSGIQDSQLVYSLYGAWSRTISILGFSWLVFCCATGHARIINYILSLKLWIPLSRITYMLYLVHFLIQYHQNFHIRFAKDMTDITIIWTYFADLFISVLLSLSLVLIFESPLIALEKLILGRNKTGHKVSPGVQNGIDCSNTKDNGKIMTIQL